MPFAAYCKDPTLNININFDCLSDEIQQEFVEALSSEFDGDDFEMEISVESGLRLTEIERWSCSLENNSLLEFN